MSIAALCTLVFAVQSVSEVPDPRPARLVVDQANVLDDATEARLDAALLDVRTRLGPEIAVVTVDDVPATPKEFATALFNHWKLGTAAKNDGVLVLLVMGKRRLEVETGTGLEAALPSWLLAEMQAADMVPRFKQGDFGGGLEQGTLAIIRRLGNLPGEGERDLQPGEYRSDGVVVTPPVPAGQQPPSTPPRVEEADDDSTATTVVLFGALGGSGLGGLLIGRRLWRRRRCDTCKVKMLELDEVADDKHLSEGQQTEERINSVDYDVLICPGCQDTRVLRDAKWFSGRRKCPSCSFKTGKRTSTTIQHATYDSGGLVRVDESCAHCSHSKSYTRRTSPKTRPSTSSSSSSSYSSSSSSRSSSSYSSSSRSSGGSSRGGGAGSSW